MYLCVMKPPYPKVHCLQDIEPRLTCIRHPKDFLLSLTVCPPASVPLSLTHPVETNNVVVFNNFCDENETTVNSCNLNINSSSDGSLDNLDEPSEMSRNNENNSGILSRADADLNCDLDLRDKLKQWAMNSDSTHSSITKLLHILSFYHPELPKDCRTLLQTPIQMKTTTLETGHYCHLGLKNALESFILMHPDFDSNFLNVAFNIDGIPLYKSTNSQIWPILGQVKNFNAKPFPIGIFYGTSKPTPLELYLYDFVSELKTMCESNLIFQRKRFKVKIFGFICDAPARSFMKCIKHHSGYSSCEKCLQTGEYVDGRVVFERTTAPKRTDFAFNQRVDDDHHTGVSPLQNLPREFNRKPRSLTELARWKATELRTFLLYLGPLVLNKTVDLAIYEHFLLLHCAITIIISDHHISKYKAKFADDDDVETYGGLDNFSAFSFETYLNEIKRLVKSTTNPLAEIHNRLTERNFVNQIHPATEKAIQLKLKHNSGPVIDSQCRYEQYNKDAANQAAVNSLLKDTEECFKREGRENKLLWFLVNNEEVITLYDVPHLFKGLTNNLLEDLQFKIGDKGMVAKWDHIVTLYNLDISIEDQLCFKLTDKHVLKRRINKMKVSYCTLVFSHQVGSLMKRIAMWGMYSSLDSTNLGPEAADLLNYCFFFDKLFDSLNVKSKTGPATQPLKGRVTAQSPHEEYWRAVVKVLQSMTYFDNNKKNSSSYVRAHGVRNISSGASHFMSSFKTLFVNNFLTYHSPFSNCEKDDTSNLKSFMTTNVVADVNVSLQSEITDDFQSQFSAIPLHKRTKLNKCTITYYARDIIKAIGATKFKTRKEIVLPENVSENFLIIDDGTEDRIIVFATPYMIQFLSRNCEYFGDAQVQTLRNVFPGIVVTGCNFNAMEETGLTKEYKENEEIRQHIRLCAAFAHIPEDATDDVYVYIIGLFQALGKSYIVPSQSCAMKKWRSKRARAVSWTPDFRSKQICGNSRTDTQIVPRTVWTDLRT
ncbi:hypothetical protein NQ315_016279 [Exocentrus adspersus]|uniref:Transposable element P transposase-like GTP-binding insertion domain-containing protein n=1 Tax=Exocentrus adspersus TaxID=1586481 RepID=A0AAV8VD43_9CUCU|nr:hypothetical protein NQ315_016279 [Exocentrus adspersus]